MSPDALTDASSEWRLGLAPAEPEKSARGYRLTAAAAARAVEQWSWNIEPLIYKPSPVELKREFLDARDHLVSSAAGC